jgi:2-polyprenyl-3-methyl-5-hydroxy-6-metoxy-1,4-benzoquinol methylase
MNIQGPQEIMQLMQGAQATSIFRTAIELGVFGQIAKGNRTASSVASAIGCKERPTRILLDACGALGLIEKKGREYALPPATEQFLVPGKPTYMGELSNLFCGESLWNSVARLTDAVRNDGTVMPEHAETPQYRFWEMFARSTAAMAAPAAQALDGQLAEYIGKRPKARVLDVAAGSGFYGFTLARRPNVELRVLDWPNVLVETRNWAKKLGVDESRVGYIEGSLFDVGWQGPYDVIVMSHIFHHFDAPTCEALMKKAAAALAPGGRLAIHEFIYDADLKNPMAAMFSITMLTTTRHGEAFSAADYARWFESAGLRTAGMQMNPGMPTTFLFADKP